MRKWTMYEYVHIINLRQKYGIFSRIINEVGTYELSIMEKGMHC